MSNEPLGRLGKSVLEACVMAGAVASISLPSTAQIRYDPPIRVGGHTANPQLRQRVPSTVKVISGDLIRSSGVRYISDVLRLVPGLEVQRINSTDSNVSARGYNDSSTAAQGMLALIDGRHAYNNFYGGVFWDTLPIDIQDIERVEVLRGPGSYRFGPNALHGVINFVTKSALTYQRDTVSLTSAYGTDNSSVSSLIYSKRDPDGRSGIKARFGWDDIGQFDQYDENARDKRHFEIRYTKLFDEAEKSRHHLDLIGGYSQQRLDLLIPPVLAIQSSNFDTDMQETFLTGTYTYHDFRAQVSWNRFDASTEPERFYSPFRADLDTVDIDLQYSWDLLEGHKMTAGTGARYSTFRTSDPDVASGRHHTDLGWIFLQDEVELDAHWFLTAGLRIDRHSTAGNNVSPRAALVWEFLTGQSLRLSYGEGFRNPSLREIWFNLPVTVPGLPSPVTIEGNRDLEAEEIQSYELAYFGRPWGLLDAEVNLYYNLVDGLVEFQTLQTFPGTTIPSRVAPGTENNEKAYGLEVELRHEFNDTLSGFANYSLGYRVDRETGVHNPLAPRHKANTGLRLNTGTGISGMVWATYFDETSLVGVEVGDYLMVNGSIAYEFDLGDTDKPSGKGRVFLDVFNALDNDHREHPQGDSYGLILMAGLGFRF